MTTKTTHIQIITKEQHIISNASSTTALTQPQQQVSRTHPRHPQHAGWNVQNPLDDFLLHWDYTSMDQELTIEPIPYDPQNHKEHRLIPLVSMEEDSLLLKEFQTEQQQQQHQQQKRHTKNQDKKQPPQVPRHQQEHDIPAPVSPVSHRQQLKQPQQQQQPHHRLEGFSPLTCLLLSNSPTLDFGLNKFSPLLQCKYRKGRCRQPRTIKKNGGLHTFCEYHRVKSCENQRKFDRKRRSKCRKNPMVLRQLDMNQLLLQDLIPQHDSIVSRPPSTTTPTNAMSSNLPDFPLYLHEPHLYVSTKASTSSSIAIKKAGHIIEQGHFINNSKSFGCTTTNKSLSSSKIVQEKELNMYRLVQ